jgi:predicted Zn-dependent peptidase
LEFRHQRLDNGLDVIAECNPRAHATALAFCVNTGSRDESDEVAGVSHFLEHMAFKGTSRRTAAEVNRELDEIGSHANAFTSEEQTVYYVTVLPEYAERAIDLLADMMRPALTEQDFELEKQVILEEIYRNEDQPPFGAHEKCMAAHFGSHPLGRSVLGTVESVSGLTPAAMRAYWQRRYSPGNMVLAAAGKVDFPGLVALAESHCGHWEPWDAPRAAPRAAPHRGYQVLPKELATQQYAVQIANGPAATDDDRYAGRVLTTILGDDVGSRLFWELIDTGLAEFAAMASCEYQGTGIVMTQLSCEPDQTADNLQRIFELQQAVQREGVTAEELSQAKNKIAAHIVLQSERSANRLFALAGTWIQLGCYRTVHEEVELYRAVDRDQIAAVLAKYPLTENTTVVIGPLSDVPPPRVD